MFVRAFLFIQFLVLAAEARELNRNLTKQVWHSYEFDTGVGNREEIYIVKVDVDKNFVATDGVFKWRSLQAQGETIVIGLGINFVLVATYNNKNDYQIHKEEIQGFPKDLSVFQKWDMKSQSIQSFVVLSVSTNEESYFLKWYTLQNKRMKFLCDWQFHQIITHIDIVKVNHQSKLLVVSHRECSQKKDYTIDIYDFNLTPQLDLWLFEKISLDGLPSAVAVFSEADNTFLSVSFPFMEAVVIWRYSKTPCLKSDDENHFKLHQKIFSGGVKSFVSFQIGFLWHLAVAGDNSSIFQMGENFFFRPVSHSNVENCNHWLLVPIDTYREDVILLSSSNSGISALLWSGKNNVPIVKNFTELACGNDVDCATELNGISLINAATFQYNGYQNIIISPETGFPFLIKLLVRLRPLPDKISIKLNEVVKLKNALQSNYEMQLNQVRNVMAVNRNQMNSTVKLIEKSGKDDLEIYANRSSNENFRPVSQIKNRTDKKFADLKDLKSRIDSLRNSLDKLNFDSANDSSPIRHYESFVNNLPSEISLGGIIFHDKVVIKNLNLSTINGLGIKELLKNSYRKNTNEIVGGRKTFKNVKAENVLFERVNDVLACDIVFADDPWESTNKNVINGNLLWEGKINVLHDFSIRRNGEINDYRGSMKNFETVSNISKHAFGELHFEELEISKKANVRTSVNNRPLILPVHAAPSNVDYLDMANQARIEFANVEGNLEIDYLNGENFSRIMEEISSGIDRNGKKCERLKIDGVLRVKSIQARNINSVNVRSKKTDSLEARWQGNKTIEQNILRSSSNSRIKRNIYVFRNLEVNGILFSNELNNMSWRFLNDTLRKGVSTVVNGTKTFKKSPRVEKINAGRINGDSPDVFMTDFSDQSIRFDQTFKSVHFENLTLKGKWNEIDLEELHDSILRHFASGDFRGTNLTFSKGYDISMENVTVTDFVNGVDLKNWKNNGNVSITGIESLKLLKASVAIVNESLNANNNINGINLTRVESVRVSLKENEIADRNVSQSNLNVAGNLTVANLNGNGIPIDSNDSNRVLNDFLDGKISGIKKLTVKGNVDAADGINGFDLSKIRHGAIFIGKPFFVSGNVTFENVVRFENVNVTDRWNGIQLKKFEGDVVVKQSHVILTGEKKFSTLRVAKDLMAEFLNGRSIREIVTAEGDQAMKGIVRIKGNVRVKGNVTSRGNVNDVSIPYLLKKFSAQFESYVFGRDLKLISDSVTVKNLFVGGEIRNVTFENLIKNSISKEGNGYNITGRKSFNGKVKFESDIRVEGTINNLNVNELISGLNLVNGTEKIGGKVIINEAMFNDLKVDDYFNSSLVNDFEMNDWFDDGIPLDRDDFVNAKLKFEKPQAMENVQVGLINGHMSSAVISLKGKQFVPAYGIFERFNSTSDITVGGLVNGMNLIAKFENSISLSGDQKISNEMIFLKDFVIDGNLTVDHINGKPVKNFMTLDTEQVIDSDLIFDEKVIVKSNVNRVKFINGINLKDWYGRSVLLNREQEINGFWVTRGKVKAQCVRGNGTLDAGNLGDIAKDVERNKMMILKKKNETELEYYSRCHEVKELSKELIKLPYLFHQFEVVHILDSQSIIESVIPLKIATSDYLIVTFLNECFSTMYKWNRDNANFTFSRRINIGLVTKWLVTNLHNSTYLITSSLHDNVECEKNLRPGNIWIFNENSEKYVHAFTGSAFADISQPNSTSEKFFTLEEKGSVYEWTINGDKNVGNKFLVNVGHGDYKFVDYKVIGKLAVSNGREVKVIDFKNEEIVLSSFFILNGNIVALPVNGKNLTASILKDKIVIYENLREEKIFCILQTYKPGSVLWFNYGFHKQAFLIVSSHHKLIEIFEYKSVSGFIKRMSLQLFSTRLQSMSLPIPGKYQLTKFIAVIQKHKIIFLKADMLGDFYQGSNFQC